MASASSRRRSGERIETPSGRIAYREQGTGPVALFVHGVLLNGHLWRHQLAGLSDIRRCLAPDLLAHGDTEITATQDVSVTANATMLREFLDALDIAQVDLVGNDSGGGIAQIFAATLSAAGAHARRSPTATPTTTGRPEPFKPFLAMAAGGGLRGTLGAMLADKNVFRSPEAFGPAYEHPERVSDETIDTYLRAARADRAARLRDLERFLAAFDCAHTRGDRGAAEEAHGADAHRLGHRRRLLRREVVEAGWPRPSRGRPAGSSSTAPASSSPRSGGQSSTGCCASIGRPPDPADGPSSRGLNRVGPAGSARPARRSCPRPSAV